MFDSVVTGSAGFIGSHLTDRLLDRGERVLGIDSFDSYYGRPQKVANLEGALASPRFRLLRADLFNPDSFRNRLNEFVMKAK